jgi:muramoyltetrapeptide carboxypeptidase
MEKPLKLNNVICSAFILCVPGCSSSINIPSTPINSYKLLSDINENKISLVAPASWIDNDESKTMQKSYPTLWSKISFQYAGKYEYLSNTDEQRYQYFKTALFCKDSSVVWATRGGYGCARLIPYLLNQSKPPVHKWVIGYSDITALHLFVSQKWGWKSIHGAVAKEIIDSKKDPKNFQFLEEILSGSSKRIIYPGLTLLNGKFNKPIMGKLTGGNATLISTSIGTPWQLNAEGKIVILEESGQGYRVDRMFQHLKHSKILDGAVAIVIGDVIASGADTNLIINDFIKDIKVPVFKTDIFGHGDKNYPWIYNADAVIEIDPTDNYQVTFQTQ